MRLRTLAAFVSFFLLTLNDGARAQQPERSVDTSPAWNDNSLITVQKKGGKAVIPAHYYVTGLTTDVSGLESADGWVDYQEKVHQADVRRLDRADLTLNAAELKGSHHRVYYFGNHFEDK